MHQFAFQPRAKRGAAHNSFIRAELSRATRFPRRRCDTVTALCRFTARGLHAVLVVGTPRIVEVTGAKCSEGKLGTEERFKKAKAPSSARVFETLNGVRETLTMINAGA
jgi:hypothetical protein